VPEIIKFTENKVREERLNKMRINAVVYLTQGWMPRGVSRYWVKAGSLNSSPQQVVEWLGYQNLTQSKQAVPALS